MGNPKDKKKLLEKAQEERPTPRLSNKAKKDKLFVVEYRLSQNSESRRQSIFRFWFDWSTNGRYAKESQARQAVTQKKTQTWRDFEFRLVFPDGTIENL